MGVGPDHAAAYGLGFIALRYFNAAGASLDGALGEDHHPETHLIPIVLQAALGIRAEVEVFGTDYPTPDGTCARDYIHVDDLAEAHLLALERLEPGQGRAYNLGIGTGYSVREVLAACEEVTGRRIPVQFGPRRSGDPPALVASAEGRGASWAGSPGIPTCERSWKRRGVGTGSTRGATTAEADAAVNGRRLRARGKGRFGHWEDSELPRWPLSEQGGADPVIKAPDGAPDVLTGRGDS